MSHEEIATLWLPDYHGPSMQDYGKWKWYQIKTAKRKAVEHVMSAMVEADCVDLNFPDGDVSVEYTRVRGGHGGVDMDDENLHSTFKCIGDALQTIGVVANDRQIRLTSKQEQGERGTRLVIKEMKP
jgi:hypothetical protein